MEFTELTKEVRNLVIDLLDHFRALTIIVTPLSVEKTSGSIQSPWKHFCPWCRVSEKSGLLVNRKYVLTVTLFILIYKLL